MTVVSTFLPFSPEQLRSLQLGDTFSTEGFCQGVTPEPVRWEVRKIEYWTAGAKLELRATYLGVYIGGMQVTFKGKKVDLRELRRD